MCANSVSKALGEPQGRDRAAFPGPFVSGVDLRIAWDGGVRLRDAARVNSRVVGGEVVDLHLPRYASTQDVAEALRAIGVAVTDSASPERAVSSWFW